MFKDLGDSAHLFYLHNILVIFGAAHLIHHVVGALRAKASLIELEPGGFKFKGAQLIPWDDVLAVERYKMQSDQGVIERVGIKLKNHSTYRNRTQENGVEYFRTKDNDFDFVVNQSMSKLSLRLLEAEIRKLRE